MQNLSVSRPDQPRGFKLPCPANQSNRTVGRYKGRDRNLDCSPGNL